MATTYTPNYHLGKQEDRSDKFLMQVITENMDIIDEQLKATDDKATAAAAGLKYKGAVNYYSDLPNDAEIGDAYTVLYAGSSGTVPDGTEYVWGELNGTAQWIDFSKDTYTKAEVDALLAAKQALLNANNKLDPAYINYDSTHAAVTEAQRAQISTNQTNIGKVQTQANYNTNNGVKNFATENNFSNTGYYKDVPVDGSLTGNVVVYFGNITSTDTDANKCAVLFMYTDDTSSPIHLVNRGTSSSFSANLEANVLKSIRIYSSDNYVHSSGDTVTVTNFMVCPKSLYDADSTYEPYALPNSTITPELIELVDSGAKNICNWHEYTLTSTTYRGVSYTNNNDGTVTVNTDSQGSTADDAYANLLTIYTGLPFGLKVGDTIVFASTSDKASMVLVPYLTDHYGTSERGSKSSPCIYTIPQGTTGLVVRLTVRDSGTVVSNEKVSAFICTKAAWDVSQKIVPHRPTYEETVEQVATNKNNILLNGVRICAQWKNTKQAETYQMSMTDFIRDDATGVTMGTYLVHMIAYASGECGIYLVSYVQPTGGTNVKALTALGTISTLTITADKEIEIPVISSTYGAKVTIYALT